MNQYTRGLRNAFRNVIRSISIIFILGLSIGLSLSMLLANQAVSQKIDSVEASVGNTVSISPAGVRGFDGGGNALTEDNVASVKGLANVTSVSATLNDRLTSSDTNLVSSIEAGSLGQRFGGNSNALARPPEMSVTGDSGAAMASFTPPIIVTGTNNPKQLGETQGGGTLTLTSGETFAANSSDNVAIVGSNLATKNDLKVGSTFTAYNTTITIIGIYDTGNTFGNNQLIMPLKTVQTLSNQAGAVTSITLTVNSIENVNSVTSAAQKVLGTSADVTNASAQAQTAIEPLKNIQTISLYSLIGSVVAGSIIIFLTMIMIVRERRREIGVLKAIGATNRTIVTQFGVEALTLTACGAVVGIVFGAIAGNPITKMLVNNSTASASGPSQGGGIRTMGRGIGILRDSATNIHATVGWEIIVYGLVAALVIALIGSTLASFTIAKIRPAEVMRTE